jgi:hypothetical protein
LRGGEHVAAPTTPSPVTEALWLGIHVVELPEAEASSRTESCDGSTPTRELE